MGIKFNCSNGACRQRVEVDDSMAGKMIECPGCSTRLLVPVSREIKFNCPDALCEQHIVVDVSEAGRFLKCPSCGKPLQVPGSPSKPLVAGPPVKQRQVVSLLETKKSAGEMIYASLGRLSLGWGLGVTITVILIYVLNAFAISGLPPDLDKKSDEIYNHGIGEFRDTPVEVRGSSMLVLQYNENDVNILRLDLSTNGLDTIGKIRNIAEDMGFVWVGWSPTSRKLAYLTKGAKHNQGLFLCDGSSGKQEKPIILTTKDKVQNGVWLSEKSLLLACESGDIYVMNLETNNWLGKYGKAGLAKLPLTSTPSGGMALISGHSFSYINQGNIWLYDLLTGKASQLTDLNSGTLNNLSYNPENRKYIFTLTDSPGNQNSVVCSLDAVSMMVTNLQSAGFNGQWVQGGKGFAFLQDQNGRTLLTLESSDKKIVYKNIFNSVGADVESYTVSDDGNSIFAVISDERGASSVVQYDIAHQQSSVVAKIQDGYSLCKVPFPVTDATTNSSGQMVDFYYLPPVDIELGKKYPVLMDMTSSSRHDHGRDAEYLANCGIYYVSPNRIGITKWGVTPTEENVMAVYEKLMHFPNVDKNRVYSMGESATTGTACDLVNDHPEMWRGLILMEPAAYPSLDSLTGACPSVLIIMGDEDQYNGTSLKYGRAEAFLQAACAHLVSARIHYEKNTPHAFQPEQFQDGFKTVAAFLLSNY